MENIATISGLLELASNPVSTANLLRKASLLLQEISWLKIGTKSALLLKHDSHFITAVERGLIVDEYINDANVKGERERLRTVLEDRNPVVLEFFPGGAKGGERFLLTPLVSAEQALGVAVFSTGHPGGFSGAEADTLSFICQVISNAFFRLITEEVVELKELELEEARLEVVEKLGIASEYKDKETANHIQRMSEYSSIIAKGLGLSFEEQESIRLTAPMHDVGKIGIPDKLLLKPGPLTADEYEVIKTHTLIGATILSGDSRLMTDARSIAIGHHEKWDGSGYPHGLKGESIPLFSRICAVSDVFDALSSKRPYKEAWPVTEARQWIVDHSGTHFDPAVVDVFIGALPEILRVREIYRDEVINPNEKLYLPPLGEHKDDFFSWDDSYSVGIDTIDEHHRYLFDLTNEVYRAVEDGHGSKKIGKALKALIMYTRVHFRAEEELMKKHQYPRLDIHTQEHETFCQQLDDYIEDFRENPLILGHETLMFLKQWLINHVKGEDSYLRELADS